AVAGVLDEWDDPPHARAGGVVFVRGLVAVVGPVAPVDVEHETQHIGVDAPTPAAVDAPELGRLAVGELGECGAVGGGVSDSTRWPVVARCETEARDHLKALS